MITLPQPSATGPPASMDGGTAISPQADDLAPSRIMLFGDVLARQTAAPEDPRDDLSGVPNGKVLPDAGGNLMPLNFSGTDTMVTGLPMFPPMAPVPAVLADSSAEASAPFNKDSLSGAVVKTMSLRAQVSPMESDDSDTDTGAVAWKVLNLTPVSLETLAEDKAALPVESDAAATPVQIIPQLHLNAVSAPPFAPAGQAGAHTTSDIASGQISIPLNHPDWEQALGQHIMWLIGEQRQVAEMNLNPPHLGPLEMRITLENNQANINFTSMHAVVRDSLEAAVPRLREMLADNGLNLIDVNVSQHSFAHTREQAGDSGPFNNEDSRDPVTDRSWRPQRSLAIGLVDFYV